MNISINNNILPEVFFEPVCLHSQFIYCPNEPINLNSILRGPFRSVLSLFSKLAETVCQKQ